jgi:hypothetical protein
VNTDVVLEVIGDESLTVEEIHDRLRQVCPEVPTRRAVFTVLDRLRLDGHLTAKNVAGTTVRIWRRTCPPITT